MERLERSTQEKLTSAKRELGEREGEVARLRSLLRQKEEEVRQVGDVAERLTRERDNVTDVVRQEFADRSVMYCALCYYGLICMCTTHFAELYECFSDWYRRRRRTED